MLGADLVLYHGLLYTFDPDRPRATALAAREGVIVYVGDDATARSLLAPGGEALDLHGYCAIPGLVDAHLHFDYLSRSLLTVNAETATLGEALTRVAEHAAALPDAAWITGHGWNHNAWDGRLPTAAHLDQATPHHAVALSAKSGHALWVNSRALQLAGISRETPDPPGGQIVRDAQGEPTGILLESASELVFALIPEPTLDEVVEAQRQGMALALRSGLTGIHDMDGPRSFAAEQVLHQRGELGLRVLKSIPLERLDEAMAVGLRTGLGDDWLRVGQIKMFADGALGPQTALMLEPYEGAPHNVGIAATPFEELREAAYKAGRAGLACAIHALGDRAVRQTLDIYDELRADPCLAPLRQRIEHVQLVHPNDLDRLATLGVIASMQPIHATSDMFMAERHWGARCAGSYALGGLAAQGVTLALGSDCPVETLDPLKGIHAAVTRRRADGSPGAEGWYPAQRLTVEQAVRGYTWGPAYAAGMEHKLGALAVGKLADVTILDQDIFAIDPMEILHARVMGTLVGGRFGWRAPF